jgi:hypothetical protein
MNVFAGNTDTDVHPHGKSGLKIKTLRNLKRMIFDRSRVTRLPKPYCSAGRRVKGLAWL